WKLVMLETKLEQLFAEVKEETKQFKITQPNGDGRAFWQPLKKLFAESGIQANNWKITDEGLETLELIYNLPESDEKGQIIPINHFLRQHARIPKEEKPTLQRIMQIALNSGQFMAAAHDFKELENFDYTSSGLDQIPTYIWQDDMIQISEQISDSLVEKVHNYFRPNN
ncbi:MAG: hypothetical protein ACLFTJ_14380, partial [Halothece sp.]